MTMGMGLIGRLAALAIAVLVVAAVAFVDGRVQMDGVSAQAQPTVAGSLIQLPPPVPGLDYTPPDPSQATIPEAATTTGTPVAPASASDTGAGTVAPAIDGSVTASLGGSDISVSSVGGSYERDAPNKRREDRERRR